MRTFSDKTLILSIISSLYRRQVLKPERTDTIIINTTSEDEEIKIKSLPLILRIALDTLVGVIKKILNNECNEDEVADTIATLDANAGGRYANEDLVNYDQAARILGVSVTNRVKLKLLLDLNGIKQVVMHNQRVGFKRSQIMALRTKLFAKRNK